jgi:hypothetical protein
MRSTHLDGEDTMHKVFLALLCSILFSVAAQARTVEPGSIWLSGALGPGFKMGSRLGFGNFLVVAAQGEYAFSEKLSAVGDLTIGNLNLFGTKPLRIRAGGRYRLSGIELPVSPYAQAELSLGKLENVLGASLTTWGVRFSAGADYFLTAKTLVGAVLGYEFLRTAGPRPTAFGQLDLLFLAGIAF